MTLRCEGNGSPPGVAAATITRALTTTHPRAVYLTGKDSRRLAILSLLPILGAARRRIVQLPAPGSRISQPTRVTHSHRVDIQPYSSKTTVPASDELYVRS